MPEFRHMQIGDIDAFITSGTFFVGIFMALIERLHEGDECQNLFCRIYGVSLAITTIAWLFLVAFAFMYRIHHKRINRIIIVTTHILMRFAIITSIISVNCAMWHNYEDIIGKIAGLTAAIFTSSMTGIMLIIYLVDLYQYNKKRREREEQETTDSQSGSTRPS